MPTISSTIASQFRLATSKLTEPKPNYWTSLSEDEQDQCRGPISSFRYKDKAAWNIDGCLKAYWTNEVLPKIEDVCNDDKNRAWMYRGEKVQVIWSTVLYLLGAAASPTHAKPTIFILSASGSFNKKTVSLIRRHASIENLNHGFDVFGHKEPVLWRASDDPLAICQDPTFLRPESLCGSQFLAVPSGATSGAHYRYATMGGVVKIGGLYHGLTVAHTFVQASSLSDTASVSSTDSDMDIDLEVSSLYSNENNRAEAEATRSDDATSHQVYSIYLNSGFAANPAQPPDVLTQASPTGTFLGRLAVPPIRLHTTEIHELPYPRFMSIESDWALVELHDPRLMVPNTVTMDSKAVTVNSVARKDDPPKGRVFVASGCENDRYGYGHGSTIGLALPGAGKLRSVWAIDYKCAPGMCGAWALSPNDGKFYGMVVAAIPGLGVTCIMPAETILSGIRKRWQDARQELFDLLPREAISAEEILATSISKSYVPDPNNSLLTGTGRDSVQDGRGVSAELVPYHMKPDDPRKLISEPTTEIQVLKDKLHTVIEEVQRLDKRLENQLRTANDLHNIAKQTVTQLEQDKEKLQHRLSKTEKDLTAVYQHLDQLSGDNRDLKRASSKRMDEAASQADSLRREIEILKTQAQVPLSTHESGRFGPMTSISASMESRNAPLKPGSDHEFWIPDDGIVRDVITYETQRYLGHDAQIRPGRNDEGRTGYFIIASRAPTTEMIQSMKEATAKYLLEIQQSPRLATETYSSSKTATSRDEDLGRTIPQPLPTRRRRRGGYDSDDSMDLPPVGRPYDRDYDRRDREPEPRRGDRHGRRGSRHPREIDPRQILDPRYQDLRVPESRGQDPRYQHVSRDLHDPRDPRMIGDPRIRDPRTLSDPRYPDPRYQDSRDIPVTSGHQQVAYGAAFAGSSTTDYTMPRVTQTAAYYHAESPFSPPSSSRAATADFLAATSPALDMRDPRTGQARKHENLPFTGHAH